MPEIIRKVDEKWAEVRKIQLHMLWPEPAYNSEEEKEHEEILKPQEENIMDPNMQHIFEIIKELDAGDGADFEAVVSKANVLNPERTIKTLLEQGEIFELRPGKLKVLE